MNKNKIEQHHAHSGKIEHSTLKPTRAIPKASEGVSAPIRCMDYLFTIPFEIGFTQRDSMICTFFIVIIIIMHTEIMMSTLFIYKTIDSSKGILGAHTKTSDFKLISIFFFVYPHKYLVENPFNIYKLFRIAVIREGIEWILRSATAANTVANVTVIAILGHVAAVYRPN